MMKRCAPSISFSDPERRIMPQPYLHMGYIPHIIAQRNSLLPMVTLAYYRPIGAPISPEFLATLNRQTQLRLATESEDHRITFVRVCCDVMLFVVALHGTMKGIHAMIDPLIQCSTISLPSRALRKPVGITKGPGESNHEYTFVSRDDEQELKNGEYVYYELLDPDMSRCRIEWQHALTRRVLGRFIKRVPLQLYPIPF